MHHPHFKHETRKEQEKKEQKKLNGVRKKMQADIRKYETLKSQLLEVEKTCMLIKGEEKETFVKQKIVPILNRVNSYVEWFDSIQEKEEERGKLVKFREMMKDPEKKKKLIEAAASIE
jgi:hypothetical protein